jgi:predicted nucleic acid-binding protein
VRVFFDTSVMVAAFWGDHKDHERSLEVFAAANRETGACGAHSLAEVYAAMTALPVRPVLSAEQVCLFVEQIPERLTIITLDEADYLKAIREVAERRAAGGRVYDALLLACARKSQAETIYTWDVRHFRQLAPDLAERIRTPSD